MCGWRADKDQKSQSSCLKKLPKCKMNKNENKSLSFLRDQVQKLEKNEFL